MYRMTKWNSALPNIIIAAPHMVYDLERNSLEMLSEMKEPTFFFLLGTASTLSAEDVRWLLPSDFHSDEKVDRTPSRPWNDKVCRMSIAQSIHRGSVYLSRMNIGVCRQTSLMSCID